MSSGQLWGLYSATVDQHVHLVTNLYRLDRGIETWQPGELRGQIAAPITANSPLEGKPNPTESFDTESCHESTLPTRSAPGKTVLYTLN